MKNYIQPGENVTVTAPSDVASGEGVKVGSLFGIASVKVLAGQEVALTRRGVFSVAKVSAQAWAIGAKIYWDDGAKLFTTTVASNALVGCAHAVAANPSAEGEVLLTGQV